MKDHLEKFINQKDEDYFDKFFEEDEVINDSLTDEDLVDDELDADASNSSMASSSLKTKVSKSVIKKKTHNIKALSEIINKATEEIYFELEKLIDGLEDSSIEGHHQHADTLLEMSDFTEKMLSASKSINEIKDKI